MRSTLVRHLNRNHLSLSTEVAFSIVENNTSVAWRSHSVQWRYMSTERDPIMRMVYNRNAVKIIQHNTVQCSQTKTRFWFHNRGAWTLFCFDLAVVVCNWWLLWEILSFVVAIADRPWIYSCFNVINSSTWELTCVFNGKKSGDPALKHSHTQHSFILRHLELTHVRSFENLPSLSKHQRF